MADNNITHLPKDETIQAGLSAIANAIGSSSITIDTEMSDSSENAVQNKVIKEYVDAYAPFVFTMVVDETTGNIVGNKTFGEIKSAVESDKIVIEKTVVNNIVAATNLLLECSIDSEGLINIGFISSKDNEIVNIKGEANDYPTLNIGS